MKTIRNLFKQDKEKFTPPKSVQDCIPVQTIYKDGIFQVSKNKYSKCFRFTDINYAVASRPDKEAMFLQYSELLNSLDPGATSKITVLNRRLNRVDFEKNIMIPLANDSLDEYRKEYNAMLLKKALGANSIIQEKFLTISVSKKNIEEARNYFARINADLNNHFNQLGSRCIELNGEDRLRLAHDFYRIGEENIFTWDMLDNMRKGHSFKDYICPDTFSFQKDYFEMGDKFGRVFFLKDYASYIKDDMVAELTDLNRNLMLSIDIIPIPMDEAIKTMDVVMLLRIQFERLSLPMEITKEEYHRQFGLTMDKVMQMKENAIIMHPAPVNRGLEIADDVVECSKSRIFKQMTNGVYARMAVISDTLDGNL